MTKLTEVEFNELCQSAILAAQAAGRYIQSQFDQSYSKQRKEGGDSLASQVVTEVDLKAQEIIIQQLQNSIETYDFGLLTEETPDDESRTLKDYFWCIDPMDGTLPFTEHRTGYAVSIALVTRSGDPKVGVAYIPDLDMCYSSIVGQGVKLNGAQFHRSDPNEDVLHVFMDQSFKTEPYFLYVTHELNKLLEKHPAKEVDYHSSYGGVRNALGVMSSSRGCYIKFPKKRKGCGSIWDYAATRLFFEELGLQVADSYGSQLHLNNPKTTFMNECGILYATDDTLSTFIIGLGERLVKKFK